MKDKEFTFDDIITEFSEEFGPEDQQEDGEIVFSENILDEMLDLPEDDVMIVEAPIEIDEVNGIPAENIIMSDNIQMSDFDIPKSDELDLSEIYEEVLSEYDEGISNENVVDFAEEMSEGLSQDGEDIVESFEEILEDTGDKFVEFAEKLEDSDEDFLFPGSDRSVKEVMFDDDEEEEESEEEEEKTWEEHRNVGDFMRFLEESYPAKIPRHSGDSIVGCEKAMLFLNKLNQQISEALRSDGDDVLDAEKIEGSRVKILRDMVILKSRMNDLKKKLNDSARQEYSKKANEDLFITKEAATARVQMVVTPFERACAGIIINGTVSAGHDVETVYDYLKEKYAFTDREELGIMQLLMDSGMPIFKDRGTIGNKPGERDLGGNPKGFGIDFIKNYFA